MKTKSSAPPAIERASEGAAWIHRFLLPHLNRRFPNQRSLACLQLWPDDKTEAEELNRLGHGCAMLEPVPAEKLRCDDRRYNFVFTGRFSARARTLLERIGFAQELFRILKPGGALLLVVGNRLCPLDLSRNGPPLHGPFSTTTLSLKELQDIFLQHGGFKTMDVLNPSGHFAWRRAPTPLRPVGNLLELFWNSAARRPALYNSIFNPTFILWLSRN